ncbi:MAG: leucine-rich repeat domain-containing protein [Saprospiraceae bacterium]|nr:leucine-rich repeat domain-containing protein [Candidatus Vicinibacter affinis]
MSQERKKIEVRINKADDPESKLKAELGRLSEDESKEALQLTVNAENCGGIDQVDRIAKALVRLSKPHWRLVLWIGSNGLESVPESVWELANLEELRLDSNKLKTLSPAIAKLTKLRRLWIERNPFEGFPEAVCKLEQLEALFVGGCQLSVLPSSFASLRNLLELNLGNNAFEQFPEVICELRSLRKLWLNGNKLSSLPQSFANLRELRELDISNNRFKEFPQVVCELPNLESLFMGNNQLSELPLAITKLVGLKFLNLSRNSFTSFPLFVGDLPQLSEFSSYGWFNLLVSISLSLAHNWCRQSSSGSPKWPLRCQFAPLPPTASRDCSTVCHHWRRLLL